MKRLQHFVLALVGAILALGSACGGNGGQAQTTPTTTFELTSPEVTEGGTLPKDYTCDGASATLPLEWSAAPADTVSFAVIMHTVASPTDIHIYWVLYGIPADVHSLARNVTGMGKLGINSKNGLQEYTPPCSQGPGPKTYTYTIYALSAEPQLTVPANAVTRDALLAAMQDITLASAELNVVYSR